MAKGDTAMIHTHSILVIFLFVSYLLTGCAKNTVVTPQSNASSDRYNGEALVLVAVDGDGKRGVRFIELSSAEEKTGYEIYFHDVQPKFGFITIKLPAPSTHVRIKEYSLSGHYGCSRGKAGYGYGVKVLPKVTKGKSYFLGTINTDMNTVYNEMPEKLIPEAKQKYHYRAHGEDLPKKQCFRSKVSL